MFRRPKLPISPESGLSQPHRSSRLKGVLFGSCLALVVLVIGGVALVIFGLFGSFGSSSSQAIDEQTVSGEGTDKVAVIPIHGPIGLTSELTTSGSEVTDESIVRAMLKKAAEDRDVKAIVLDIDSPGGGVVASRKIYEALKVFSKPVVAAYDGNVAASGAVYLSMGADKIVAYPDTITGSIGVIAEFLDVSELLQTYGVHFNTITTGQFKDIGSSTRPMTDAERTMIQSLLGESYDRFITAIAQSRQLSVEHVRAIADGRIFSGTTAKSLGLVDELGDRTRAEALASELAGISQAQIVEYSSQSGFGSLLSFLQGKVGPLERFVQLFSHDQASTSWRLAYRLN